MLPFTSLITLSLLLSPLGVLSEPSGRVENEGATLLSRAFSGDIAIEPKLKRCNNCLSRRAATGHTRWPGQAKWIHKQKNHPKYHGTNHKSGHKDKNQHLKSLTHGSDKQEVDKTARFPQFAKGKLGLVWSMSQDHMPDYAQDGIGWWYNWEAAPWSDHYPEDITYCSMLWGEKKLHDYIQKVVNKPEEGPNAGKCTLGMNEVNLGSQANMSPQRACQLVRQYQLPLKWHHDYIIGSPSTANGPTGVEWMKKYKATCPDVWDQTDFLTVHYYDTTLEGFKDWIKTMSDFDKPMLITELAAYSFSGRPQFDVGGVTDWLKKAVSWAVEQDNIIGVGWSGFLTDQMPTNKFFTGSGKPNSLFQTYQSIGQQAISSRSVKHTGDRHANKHHEQVKHVGDRHANKHSDEDDCE